jgi:hypothetical protein
MEKVYCEIAKKRYLVTSCKVVPSEEVHVSGEAKRVFVGSISMEAPYFPLPPDYRQEDSEIGPIPPFDMSLVNSDEEPDSQETRQSLFGVHVTQIHIVPGTVSFSFVALHVSEWV